eukprot:scaffold113605_cov69-Phaeocystis_antarctica.AAC.1
MQQGSQAAVGADERCGGRGVARRRCERRTLGHGVGVGQGGARPAAGAAGSGLAARDELGSAQCDSPARLGGDAAELACRSILERCIGSWRWGEGSTSM